MSAVVTALGTVARSAHVLPLSWVTKMGAVVLDGPAGLGVNAEAAMTAEFPGSAARNGSASCAVSPLNDAGIMFNTRVPGCPSPPPPPPPPPPHRPHCILRRRRRRGEPLRSA